MYPEGHVVVHEGEVVQRCGLEGGSGYPTSQCRVVCLYDVPCDQSGAIIARVLYDGQRVAIYLVGEGYQYPAVATSCRCDVYVEYLRDIDPHCVRVRERCRRRRYRGCVCYNQGNEE